MYLALLIPAAIVIGALYAAAEGWWQRRHPKPAPDPVAARTRVVVRSSYPDQYEGLHLIVDNTRPDPARR